jgi:endonuclease YncB( thermonuclease family)
VLRFLFLPVLASVAYAAEFTGSVTRVVDGDTVDVTSGDYSVRVRLYGVDAPERSQAGGTEAVTFTEALVLNKAVAVIERDIDRYGRVVGTIALPDGRTLNDELLRAGMGRWYARYAPLATDLRQLESQARVTGKGIWKDPQAQAPWDFRSEKSGAASRRGRRSQARSDRRSLAR